MTSAGYHEMHTCEQVCRKKPTPGNNVCTGAVASQSQTDYDSCCLVLAHSAVVLVIHGPEVYKKCLVAYLLSYLLTYIPIRFLLIAGSQPKHEIH